jgi:sugar transferase (PEP-CTERM/EpsH1 system associated)
MPYPPNKGDKIRSYNILRHLSQSHEVYLASHIDEPDDLQYLPTLKPMVRELHCDVIQRVPKKLLSSLALLRSKPISVSYFYSRKVQKWIDALLDRVDIDAVFCFSSPSAEYLFRSRHYNGKLKQMRRVMDFIDVDSYKWRQYAERSKGPMKLIYGLEANFLQQYENRIADEFDRLLLVSESENSLFTRHVPTSKSGAMCNGVDLDFFSPAFCSPPENGRDPMLVFTGVMDYWPNVDAVDWFARNVLPRIQAAFPNAVFCIVGSRPSPSVQRLAKDFPGVQVTGYVEDIRTYIAAADACVIPLRIARGIQNKVLEAMAMGKPVICTSQALEGIDAAPGQDVMVADDPEAFSNAVIHLLKDKPCCEQMGRQARIFVESKFSWQSNLAPLDVMLQSA